MAYEDLRITSLNLNARLQLSTKSTSLIMFIPGSRSGKFSQRNEKIADRLGKSNISTLLLDLLTDEEQKWNYRNADPYSDIDLLTNRLISLTNWILKYEKTKDMKIGFLSSSLGTAIALNASIHLPQVKAIVSKYGRSDLVKEKVLKKIKSQVLLIVGEMDYPIRLINNKSLQLLSNAISKELVIVKGASHYFDEPGKLDEISDIAIEWFQYHLSGVSKTVPTLTKKHHYEFRFPKISKLFQYRFVDRYAAAVMMSRVLAKYVVNDEVKLLAIPRGGVVIADVVAQKLLLNTFSIVLSRRLISPLSPEKTIGSIFQDGKIFLNDKASNVSLEYLNNQIEQQKNILEEQIKYYNIRKENYYLKDCITILVDDGSYSGSTVMSAVGWIRSHLPKKIIFATPVISQSAFQLVRNNVDKIEYVLKPNRISYVGDYYVNFYPPSIHLLDRILKNRIDQNLHSSN